MAARRIAQQTLKISHQSYGDEEQLRRGLSTKEHAGLLKGNPSVRNPSVCLFLIHGCVVFKCTFQNTHEVQLEY